MIIQGDKMKKNIICCSFILFLILIGSITYFITKDKNDFKSITVTVLSTKGDDILVQDNNDIIYNINTKDSFEANAGDTIVVKYTGLFNNDQSCKSCKIIDMVNYKKATSDNNLTTELNDNGIFKDFYSMAYQKLQTMTLDEKINQLLLVRYPDKDGVNILKEKQFGGYIFFEKDFKDKDKNEVINMINSLQKVSKIPILTAVDEEGGTVVRVSSNKKLAKDKFLSPQELYALGGFPAIKQDTIQKSDLLSSLGLNLNLAPVVDVATKSSAYMYPRTLGENTELTSEYAKTVIETSKGSKVSYTLKHFPGYGNNDDTHVNSATDDRSYDEIKNQDLPPFKAGIDALAEAILVNHNTVTNIDSNNPASLSPSVHNILRKDLNFTGIIMTDDISMSALSKIENTTLKAILAGNDLIITSDYQQSFNEIKDGLNNNTISEDLIDKLAFRIIAWKYYKGLIIDNQK